VPIHISARDFMNGLAQAYAGQIAGTIAGEQQRQDQDRQRYADFANALQLHQQSRSEQNRALLSNLDKLDPDSQAAALGYTTNQPDLYGPLAQTPYGKRLGLAQPAPASPPLPGYVNPAFAGLRGTPQPPAPDILRPGGAQLQGLSVPTAPVQPFRTPPAVTPAAAPGRSFTVPGGPTLTVKGVTKEQIAQRKAEIDATRRNLQNFIGATTDPVASSQAQLLLQGLTRADITTPEGYQEATSYLERATPFGTLGGQSLRDAETRQQVQVHDARIKSLQDRLTSPVSAMGDIDQAFDLEQEGAKAGKLNLIGRQLAPFAADVAEMRRLRDVEKNPQAAQQIAAKIQEQLKRGADPREEGASINKLGTLMKSLSYEQLSNPAILRKLYTDSGLGRYVTDAEGKPVPDDQVPMIGGAAIELELQKNLRMLPRFGTIAKEAQTPFLQATLGLAKALGRKIDLPAEVVAQMTEYQRAMISRRDVQLAISGRLADVAEAKLLLSQNKAKQAETESAGKLTAADKATIAIHKQNIAAIDKRIANILSPTGERMRITEITDWEHPQGDKQVKYKQAYLEKQREIDALNQDLARMGVKVTPAKKVSTPGYKAPVEAVPTETKQPGFMQRTEQGREKAVMGALGMGQPAPSPADQARTNVTLSDQGYRAAQPLIKQGKAPAPPPAMALFDRMIRSNDFEGQVRQLRPNQQSLAWTAYWYRKGGGK